MVKTLAYDTPLCGNVPFSWWQAGTGTAGSQQQVGCVTLLKFRMTTCTENLEMSGMLTAVSEMSGILLKVREVSEKNLVREK